MYAWKDRISPPYSLVKLGPIGPIILQPIELITVTLLVLTRRVVTTMTITVEELEVEPTATDARVEPITKGNAYSRYFYAR